MPRRSTDRMQERKQYVDCFLQIPSGLSRVSRGGTSTRCVRCPQPPQIRTRAPLRATRDMLSSFWHGNARVARMTSMRDQPKRLPATGFTPRIAVRDARVVRHLGRGVRWGAVRMLARRQPRASRDRPLRPVGREHRRRPYPRLLCAEFPQPELRRHRQARTRHRLGSDARRPRRSHGRVSRHIRPTRLYGARCPLRSGRVQTMPMESAPYVDCTVSWDGYWAARGKNLRANCESVRKRLATPASRSHVRSTATKSPGTRRDIRNRGVRLEGAPRHGMAQSEPTREVLRPVARRVPDQDLLRLFLLKIAGDVIAFELCTLYGGVLTGLKCGYRESHGKRLSGTIPPLSVPAIGVRRSRSRASTTCSAPQSEIKRRWATGTRDRCGASRLFAVPRGLAARAPVSTIRGLKDAVRDYVKPRAADATASL